MNEKNEALGSRMDELGLVGTEAFGIGNGCSLEGKEKPVV